MTDRPWEQGTTPVTAAPAPLVEAPAKPRHHPKLGLRTALTGLVLLTVAITAILIHLTWFYAARRNVADVVGQLNRQIVGSVQHEVRATLNDAWSVQEAVQSKGRTLRFAPDSPLEWTGFELPVREHRAMAKRSRTSVGVRGQVLTARGSDGNQALTT